MTSSTSDKNSQFDSPVLEEASVDSFSFIQSNGIGGSDTETVTVDLSAANRAPTFGEGELVLWNRLGSETEVLNSEVGPGVQLTSYKIDDWQEARIAPAKFGNGLFVNHDTREGWANDGGNFFAVDLAATTLTSERGTIEHWFEFEYDSSMRNHTYFIATSDVLASHYANKNIHADFQFSAGWNGWDYGSYGKRFFLDMAGATAFTPDYSAGPGGELEFNDGTTMHFAFVWDVAGIDGTADTLRIYVDGEEKADAQANWSTTGAMDRYLFIGSRPNYGRWDHHYNAVKGVTDNLVIWNEARTDFSDRFVEAPSTPGLGPYTVEENTLDGTIVGTVAANDADGDTLTYTLTAGNTDPDGDGNPAFAINPTTGTITVNDSGDLDYESTTGFDLEVSATDPGGLSDTATVTIALTNLAEPGNDRPEAQDAAFTLPENSPASTDVGSVMAADLDAGDTLTYAITEGNDDPDGDGQAAFAIDAANGAITINDSGDLDFETTPAYNLSVTVTDLGGLSDSAAVTVSLGDANDPPIPTDDGGTGYQTDEDSGFVTGNVLSNDTDQDGNTLSITDLDTSTTQGRVTDNGDGTFAYDPNGMFDYLHQGEQASDHFTYAIGDGHGGTDTATVTVAIDGVDHAPRIAGGGEGGLVLWNRLGSEAEVLNSEVGPDGEITWGGSPIDYSPAMFGNGLRVNSAGWVGTKVTFPAIQSPGSELGKRGTLESWVSPDHDSNDRGIRRWIRRTGPPQQGSLILGIYWRGWDQVLRYEYNVHGEPSAYSIDVPNSQISFRAHDLVHVAFVWDVEGIDGGDDTFRAYFNGEVKGASNETVRAVNGMGDVGFGAADYSQYATVDNLIIRDYAKTDFSDRFVEEPISPGLGPYTIEENTSDGTIVGTVAANDADGDTLTYTLTAGNTDPDGDGNPAFALDPTTGELTVNDSDDLDYEVTTTFDLEVSATDPGGLSDTAAVSVHLFNVAEPGNDRPEAQDTAFTLPENSAAGTTVGTVIATDLDAGDTLTYAIAAGNADPDGDGQAAFAIDASTGAITVNDSGDLDFETTPTFDLEVIVSDTGGLAANAAVTIDLTDIFERLGTPEDNILVGTAGDDLLDGADGDDILHGGAGNDTLIGGAGVDWVVESGDAGFTLTDTQLTGLGTDALSLIERASLTGGPGNDTLDASAFSRGAVVLDGGAGDDLLKGPLTAGTWNFHRPGYYNRFTGGDGDDTLTGGAGIDAIDEQGDTDFTLTANQLTGRGTDSFTGMEIARLTGGAGDNRLDASGFTGSLTHLEGGGGDDTLIGGVAQDWVKGRGNTDFTLSDTRLNGMGIDTLIQMDSARLIGGSGPNRLDVSAFTGRLTILEGGGGDDVLIGRAGGTDRVRARGDRDFTLTDTQLTGLGTDQLTDIEQVELIGGAGPNRLDVSGFNGRITLLEGGGGDDVLIGRAGGTDRVRARGDLDFILTDTRLIGQGTDSLSNIEEARLTGDAGDNRLDASAFTMGRVFLYGESGNDVLKGGSGNDRLDGGAGDDTLIGGAGIDRMEARGDTDFTLTATQLTGLSVDTLDGIEEVHLRGGPGGNRLDASGFGGSLVILEGQGGDDILIGRPGATDRVRAVGDANFTLTDTRLTGRGSDTLADIDEARLNGYSGSNSFDASAFSRGPVTLSGGGGDDTLIGGAKNDTLIGGAGVDAFKFHTTGQGIDRITDFSSAEDSIKVVSTNFGNLPLGALHPDRFRPAGSALTTTAAVFLYDGTTGGLSFDSDGNGAGAAVQIATLTGPRTLLASDIQVVAA